MWVARAPSCWVLWERAWSPGGQPEPPVTTAWVSLRHLGVGTQGPQAQPPAGGLVGAEANCALAGEGEGLTPAPSHSAPLRLGTPCLAREPQGVSSLYPPKIPPPRSARCLLHLPATSLMQHLAWHPGPHSPFSSVVRCCGGWRWGGEGAASSPAGVGSSRKSLVPGRASCEGSMPSFSLGSAP